jgi:hypothetical protein
MLTMDAFTVVSTEDQRQLGLILVFTDHQQRRHYLACIPHHHFGVLEHSHRSMQEALWAIRTHACYRGDLPNLDAPVDLIHYKRSTPLPPAASPAASPAA